MALLMLLPMLASVVTTVQAATAAELQDQINNLKNESGDLDAQKKNLAAQIKAIQNDKSKAMNRKMLLEQQIDVIRSEIANSDRQLAQYDALIAEKEVELVAAQEKEAAQYELFCKRVRYMEEDGKVSYWSILFSAADFSDLLDRVNFVNEVMEYDNAVIDMLAKARQTVVDTKADLETNRAAQQTVRDAQEVQKQELSGKAKEVDAMVDELEQSEAELEAAERELAATAAAVDKALAAREAELQRKIAAGEIKIDAGSGYQWPLSGYSTLSSLYGPRIHPVTGKPGNHTGVDIPAPKNTNITASRGGVVITSKMGSGSDWSYGNYVVISHGDGTSTLYAHMNSRGVKEGDVVAQGQVIGYVGTTGRSTGYHLHFEVRKNNVRVDPVDYFKNMTIYVRSGGKTVKLEH